MNHSHSIPTTWLQCLAESSDLGLGCWTADGGIPEANDAFLELIGCTRDELHGGSIDWRDFTPPEFAPLDRHALRKLQSSGRCTPFEKQYVRKDGKRVSVLVGAATFDDCRDAGTFYAVNLCRRRSGLAISADGNSQVVESLTERQSLVCLLLSQGESEKQIAHLLDMGLRTIEFEKHAVAKRAGIPMGRVVAWSVENRLPLLATIRSPNFQKLASRLFNSELPDVCDSR